MSRFTLDPEVARDLDEIWDHLAIQKQAPSAAQRQLSRLHDVFTLLASQPTLGEERPELGEDVRAFVVRPYLVLYRPTEHGIQVAPVVHGARDLNAILRRKKD